jgi:biopolymer transport protein ExbB
MMPRHFLMPLLLLSSSALWAQQPQPEDTPAEPDPAPEAEVTTQAPSLEQAYQREFAFLQTQKRELQSRLDAFRARSSDEQAQMNAEINALERALVAVRAQAERLDGLVFDSEQAVQTARTNVDTLSSTLLQADITLEDAYSPPSAEATPSPEDFQAMFAAAADRVDQAGQVRVDDGAFFATDGTQLDGQIIHVGQIAAYGIAGDVAGALAPAGGGELKLWDSRLGEASAAALIDGGKPATVGLFAYESLDQDVETNPGKSILEIIQSGGLIGWIITLLGLLGVGLVVARIMFLRDASASTDTLVEAIAQQVSKGDRDGAIETLKGFKGATARVLTTAIRNLDREREHLEDVISESLLNESTTLNRFGAVILVIAAVSPLLGLLGTVTGMISTFDVITEFGTGDPKLLSGGISIALVTTQLGLIVAIPLLLVGNVLSGWAERIKDEMEKSALHIVNRYIEGQQGRA